MRYCNHGRFRQQVKFLRRQFLQDGDLPFTTALSEATIAPALTAIDACWKDRIFSPLVTLWVFLSQVLSADHSCRAAVARLIAHRLSRGQPPCSARDRRLLPGPKTAAGEVLLRRGLFSRTCFGRQGRPSLAVERSARLHVRWHDGHDAGHPRKSSSLSASLQSEAGPGLPHRADRGHHFLVLRGHL